MNEVLSQDEIDQLLQAISSGEPEAEDYTPVNDTRKIKIYDFKRPDKFSKEQIRTVSIMHETFARLTTTSLSAQLRSMVHVHVASVDQLTYEEFIRSIPTPTTLAVINMDPLKGNAILEIDPNLALKAVGHSNEPNRFLTDEERRGIEGAIMLPTFELLAEEFTNADAFFNENKNNISLESIKQLKFHNNDFTPSWSNGNMCCNCTFEVHVGKKRSYEETLKDVEGHKEPEAIEGTINITFIAELAKELSDKMEGIEKEENEKERIDENILKNTKVPVEVFLGSTNTPLKDILSYKPGTIIELDTLAGEAVEIRANGATVAHGEVVVLEEKYGVRIIDMV